MKLVKVFQNNLIEISCTKVSNESKLDRSCYRKARKQVRFSKELVITSSNTNLKNNFYVKHSSITKQKCKSSAILIVCIIFTFHFHLLWFWFALYYQSLLLLLNNINYQYVHYSVLYNNYQISKLLRRKKSKQELIKFCAFFRT